MIYTIIFHKIENGQEWSWMDGNEFKTKEKANEHAMNMCREWWDKRKHRMDGTWTLQPLGKHLKLETRAAQKELPVFQKIFRRFAA